MGELTHFEDFTARAQRLARILFNKLLREPLRPSAFAVKTLAFLIPQKIELLPHHPGLGNWKIVFTFDP